MPPRGRRLYPDGECRREKKREKTAAWPEQEACAIGEGEDGRGPAGVLLLDSKNIRRNRAVATNDGLASGRMRYAGSSFRGAAFGLAEALSAQTGARPWVQAVVVIWGDFPQGQVEQDRVVYIAGSQLCEWLASLAPRLSTQQQDTYTRAALEITATPAVRIAA